MKEELPIIDVEVLGEVITKPSRENPNAIAPKGLLYAEVVDDEKTKEKPKQSTKIELAEEFELNIKGTPEVEALLSSYKPRSQFLESGMVVKDVQIGKMKIELLFFPFGTPIDKIGELIKKIPGHRPASLYETLLVGRYCPEPVSRFRIACPKVLGTSGGEKIFYVSKTRTGVSVHDFKVDEVISTSTPFVFATVKQ